MREITTIQSLMRLLRPWRWALPLVVLVGLGSYIAEGVGIGLFVPLLQPLMQSSSGVPPSLATGMLVIVGLTVIKGVLVYGNETLGAWLASGVSHAVRCGVFGSIVTMDHTRLDSVESGRLMNILGSDTWHTADAAVLLVSTISEFSAVVVFGFMLVALSWKLTLLTGLGVLVIWLALSQLNRSAQSLGRQCIERNAVLSEQMLNGLGGVRVIQSYGLEDHRAALFARVSEAVRNAYMRLDLISRAIHPASEILYTAVLAFVLCAGSWIHMPAASLLVFVVLMYRLQPRVSKLVAARVGLVSLGNSIGDVLRLIDAAPEQPSNDGVASATFQRCITFEDVSFDYGHGRPRVLHNISLNIGRGSVVAIAGTSGSGKSTLINLLCGFRQPSSGLIRMDGTPLSSLDPRQWRQNIALAGQSTFIFSGTVRENIACGRIDASDQQVRHAARAAQAETFIGALPDGFETKIGNGGASLSGGQEQRIALARGFLRNPDIFIFDEATNALDSLTEEFIHDALDRLSGKTVLIISHRLSTIRRADHVIVLDGGRVTAQGSPAKLLTQPSFLSAIRELQETETYA